jgi:hypothetical protein
MTGTRPGYRLLRAGLATGVIDGLWACVLTWIYGSTFERLWQGVASTVVGADAIGGGAGPTALGLAIHFGVAFGWSAVFLALYLAIPKLRALTSSLGGIVAVAVVYGPLIWVVMSLLVIPALVGHPPNVTYRWWIQLAGHAVFVGPPIVAGVARRA